MYFSVFQVYNTTRNVVVDTQRLLKLPILNLYFKLTFSDTLILLIHRPAQQRSYHVISDPQFYISIQILNKYVIRKEYTGKVVSIFSKYNS